MFQAWNIINTPTRNSLLVLDCYEDISKFNQIDYRDNVGLYLFIKIFFVQNHYNVRAVALSNQTAFSARFPNDLIVNGLPEESNEYINEGLLFQVHCYYCKYNNCLVPFSINIPYERKNIKYDERLKLVRFLNEYNCRVEFILYILRVSD